jgi:hypothetical protein
MMDISVCTVWLGPPEQTLSGWLWNSISFAMWLGDWYGGRKVMAPLSRSYYQLAAKAFLFVTDSEKLERDNAGLHDVTLKQVEAWRKKGPLGKLWQSKTSQTNTTVQTL